MQKKRQCSEAFWQGYYWARGLGLPRPCAEANFIPCGPDKAPWVREWRHWSAAGLRSPRLTSPELVRLEGRSGREGAPAAYAILPGSSGLVVVDVDDPSLVPALERLYGDTPVRTATPSGGAHLYYLAPEASPEEDAEPGATGDGFADVKSRTGVRGPRTYDVKARGSMCHMPGGESSRGEYLASLPPCEWEPGELRAMLPTFPVERYERDWLAGAGAERAEWEPEGSRADDVVLDPAIHEGAEAYWREAVEAIGPAREGERHEKGRRLALWLGDRGCPEDEALELMAEWNRSCSPPADSAAAARLVRDAYRTRRSALGYKALEFLERAGASESDDPEAAEGEGPVDAPTPHDGACASEGEEYAPPAPLVSPALRRRLVPISKDAPVAPPVDRDAVTEARELLGAVAAGVVSSEGVPPTLLDARALAETCWRRGLSSADAAAELEANLGHRVPPTALAAARLWRYGDSALASGDAATAAARIEIPREVFGGAPWFLPYAELAARSLPLHVDASILTGLAMFNIALRDAVEIATENADGTPWTLPAMLYAIVEAPSGAGKSALMKAWGERALAAFSDRHLRTCEYARAAEDFRTERDYVLKEWQAETTPQKARAPRADASDRAKGAAAHGKWLSDRCARMAREVKAKPTILSADIPAIPQMLLADTTPQEFVRVALRSGYVALVSTEGKSALTQFLSREGEQSDPLLVGFSRDPYRRNRVGEAHDPTSTKARDLVRSEFAAAALLMVQPGVLSPASEDEGRLLGQVARRGLLARFIVGRPPELRVEQIRERDVAARARRAAGAAHSADALAPRMAVHALLAHALREVPPPGVPASGGDEDGATEPPRSDGSLWPVHPLAPRRRFRATLTEEAAVLVWDFKLAMSERAAEGGDLSGDMLGELARRLHEIVVRVAATLRYLARAQPAYDAALAQARAALEAGEVPPADRWRAPVALPPVLGDVDVEAEDVRRAIVLAEDYLLEQARLVYRRAVFAPSEDDADKIAAWLAGRPDGSALRAEVARAEPFSRGWLERGRAGRMRLDSALQVLVDRGQASRSREPSGDRYTLAREGAKPVAAQ